MENERHYYIRSIGTKYGIITAIVMMVYFLIMRALNLIQITEFRYINYVILAVGIYMAFLEEKKKLHEKEIDYLPGLGLGAWVGAAAAIFFTLFVFIYCKIDQGFVRSISGHIPIWNPQLVNSYVVAMLIFSEIFALGIIISFVFMQLFKRNRLTETGSETES
jgi:hypothetical protein